jgi:SPP1 gp7 family putative phage head morphogenesis protein
MQGVVVAFQYSAILDDRTRANHAEMDGRIYLINDPIWDTWTPPNGFNCRCVLIPITKYEQFEVSDPPPADCLPDEGFK